MTQANVLEVLLAALDAIGVDNAAHALAEDPDVSFAALDVDSLGVIEVVARLEMECGITIPDEDLEGLERPADLLARALVPEGGSA
jgi:acyl carrier protein